VQISHSFTHFTWILTAHIIHVEKDQAEYLQAELGGEWLTPQKATQMGIPTAMKKLISAIKI
jgi:A/G-specific adenine glycosylase